MPSNNSLNHQRTLPLRDDFPCPTCGAMQDWDTLAESTSDRCCRRCGSDLQLVFFLAEKNQRLRKQCLTFLRQRRLLHATRLAKQCLETSSCEANLQLLATCYLMSGDFANVGRCLKRGEPAA